MGLNVRLYNIVSDGNYSIRYKSGDSPYPETNDSTFTLYNTGLTATTITISGLSFDTQYWIKMTDQTTGRYIIKNIYTHDSKAFPCYDTMCFDVQTVCVSPSPTPTPTVTPTVTPSLTPTPTPTVTPSCACATPIIQSVCPSLSPTIDITFSISGCSGCSSHTVQFSQDGITWGLSNTAGCGSGNTLVRNIIEPGYSLPYFVRVKVQGSCGESSYSSGYEYDGSTCT